MRSTLLSCKGARLFSVLLLLGAMAPLAAQCQSAPNQSASATLYGRCNAAYQAHDYAAATSVCEKSAAASYTKADDLVAKSFMYLISNKYSYYMDMLAGASSQETAGKSYIYGRIDGAKGAELIDAAIITFQQILDGATDVQTLEITSGALREAATTPVYSGPPAPQLLPIPESNARRP